MGESSGTPKPGSRSETASAIKDAMAAATERTAAGIALTTDIFSTAAALSTIYEIQAAEIALKRSTREDVKEFARRMLSDHKDLSDKLKSYLGGMNRPNSPPEELDPLHQVLIDDLNGASNEDFDHRYISQQESAHQNAIALFTTFRDHGDRGGLKNLAALGLPVLEDHLEMVRKLKRSE